MNFTWNLHQEDMRRFITYVMKLSWKNRTGFPSWFDNSLREQGKEAGSGFVVCLTGGPR